MITVIKREHKRGVKEKTGRWERGTKAVIVDIDDHGFGGELIRSIRVDLEIEGPTVRNGLIRRVAVQLAV